jgi:thioredoxin-related protein
LDDKRQLTNFNGELISTTDFAKQYGVIGTPTLVFLDAEGHELSEKLVGIWSIDYFGGYIDERIDIAREKLMQLSS